MGRQVPFTKVAGLPLAAQHQLQRNFEAAVLAMNGGGVKVPYTKIAGLPPEAQRQIQRNFEDLECDCTSSPVLGSIITSDGFSGVDLTALIGTPTDLVPSGGTAYTWADGGADGAGIVRADFGAGNFRALQVNGAALSVHLGQVVVATGQANVSVLANGVSAFLGSTSAGVISRWVDSSNYVYATIVADAGTSTYLLRYGKVVAGVDTPYTGSPVNPVTFGTGVNLALITTGSFVGVQIAGSLIVSTFDTSVPLGTAQGIFYGNTRGNNWSNFVVTAD